MLQSISKSYELIFQLLHMPSHARGKQEKDFIVRFLCSIDKLLFGNKSSLESLADTIQHTSFRNGQTLFSSGSRITSWYILLSGSVYVDGKLHHPIKSFGRPISEEDRYHSSDCYCLEQCDFLVIDLKTACQQSSQLSSMDSSITPGLAEDSVRLQRSSLDLSDEASSSTYSDSCCELEDSDNDFCDASAETGASFGVAARSSLLLALAKPPGQRSPSEVELLHQATRCMPAFANFNETVQRRLSAGLALASLDQLSVPSNSWSVILDGLVELTTPTMSDGEADAVHRRLGPGDCLDARLLAGEARAVGPNCRLAYLALDDYLAAVETAGADEADGRAVLRKNGQVVLVKEADPSRDGVLCVTSGTPAALLDELLSTSAANVDASFADDLLLTRLAFVSDLALADRLLLALADPPQPDCAPSAAWERAERVLLQWVGGHLVDMSDRRLLHRLAGLEARLTGRLGPQHLMRLACSSGAAERRVTCRRDRGLDFLLLGSGGGGDSFCFVSGLAAPTGDEDDSCLIDDEGRLLQPLMLGDRVLQLDDQPVDPDRLSNGAAGELLHLTVRWDPLQYHRALASMTAAASILRTISCSPPAHQSPPSQLPVRQVSMPASLATTAERQLAAPRPAPAALADRAVRVYRHDGQSRTVPVGRDTPAGVAAALAAREFGVAGVDYACWQLVEVCASLPGPALRRRALQDSVTDLDGRLPVGGRYYLRRADEPIDQCLTDKTEALQLAREAAVDLLQLDPRRLAQLLTESDAEAHRQIRPADLVLWWLGNRDGSSYKSLTAFHRLIRLAEATSGWPGRELATCGGASIEASEQRRRDRILKRLVRVALECHRLRNLCSATSLALGLAACQPAGWERRLPGRCGPPGRTGWPAWPTCP
ncbi:hypothetical protein BOX15_Mlig027217g1 [Macrostomum lignano]|uniref:Uncharacterized protein n=1 Tax=Macrostomum lignano TaxID=282301 RepID=A0A267EJJ3_9PLAT|nr:hypothetical protein BOX15_Mlig027217g1 [Macrostomum lignano]